MFAYRLLDDSQGLLLIGDYAAMSRLHEVVTDVDARSPLVTDKGGSFLALANDARKAETLDQGIRLGFEILWPTLLAQQRLLRVSLAYVDHTKWHQVVAYALEAVIEEGLKAGFGTGAQAVIDQWQRLGAEDASILDRLPDLENRFLAWNAQQRRDHLVSMLAPAWVESVLADR